LSPGPVLRCKITCYGLLFMRPCSQSARPRSTIPIATSFDCESHQKPYQISSSPDGAHFAGLRWVLVRWASVKLRRFPGSEGGIVVAREYGGDLVRLSEHHFDAQVTIRIKVIGETLGLGEAALRNDFPVSGFRVGSIERLSVKCSDDVHRGRTTPQAASAADISTNQHFDGSRSLHDVRRQNEARSC